MAVGGAGYQPLACWTKVYVVRVYGIKEFVEVLFGVYEYGVQVAVSRQGHAGANESTSNTEYTLEEEQKQWKRIEERSHRARMENFRAKG